MSATSTFPKVATTAAQKAGLSNTRLNIDHLGKEYNPIPIRCQLAGAKLSRPLRHFAATSAPTRKTVSNGRECKELGSDQDLFPMRLSKFKRALTSALIVLARSDIPAASIS